MLTTLRTTLSMVEVPKDGPMIYVLWSSAVVPEGDFTVRALKFACKLDPEIATLWEQSRDIVYSEGIIAYRQYCCKKKLFLRKYL
jgi:hypothetical protein